MGYDSNVNAGTREDNIFLPFLGEIIALSDNSRETSDNFFSLNYQVNGSKSLSQTSRLLFFASSQIHLFIHEDDYNRFSIDSNVQYIKEFDGFGTSIGIRVKPLWFDDSYYRTQAGVTIGLNKPIESNWLISSEAYFCLLYTSPSPRD